MTADGHLVAVRNKGDVIGYLPGSGDDPKALAAANAINSYAIAKLEEAGYTPDPTNSATSTDDTRFFMVREAFASHDGSTRCVVEPAVNISAWSIECISSNDIEAAYDKEKPFLEAFGNPEDIYLTPNVQGNYASVEANDGFAGYRAILQKVSGKWHLIFRAQYPPSCALMFKYSVPPAIYSKCI